MLSHALSALRCGVTDAALEPLLAASEAGELALTTEMKEAVLVSGADDLAATAKLIEAMQGLYPAVEGGKVPIDGAIIACCFSVLKLLLFCCRRACAV